MRKQQQTKQSSNRRAILPFASNKKGALFSSLPLVINALLYLIDMEVVICLSCVCVLVLLACTQKDSFASCGCVSAA
jgi:hypothetical protein